MELKNIFIGIKKFWNYVWHGDSFLSWVLAFALIFIFVKFIFFPGMSLLTGSEKPLVFIESCSMYHNEGKFNDFWENNKDWYLEHNITKEQFSNFIHNTGLNKGDMILVVKQKNYNLGDIIIFDTDSQTKYPIIHRIISLNPISTKGDNNPGQLPNGIEENIPQDKILGRATSRVPFIGWARLIFYEPFRPASERGFCK